MRTLALVALSLFCTVVAQSDATKEVRVRYAECVALEKANTRQRFEFQRRYVQGDLGPWEKRSAAEEVYEYMVVYVQAGRVRSVGLEQGSPSGDWSSSTSYCFRANGSLAFQYQNLRTFLHSQAGVNVLEVQLRGYFAPDGKNFQTIEKQLDGKSQKPVQTDYMRMPPPSFPNSGAVVKAVGGRLLPAK